MKIGDTVEVLPNRDCSEMTGKRGVIVCPSPWYSVTGGVDWGVDFGPAFKDGHTLDEFLKTNTGWYLSEKYLRIVGAESKSTKKPLLPTEPEERKKYPVCTGVLDYFPSAILEIARVSYEGNKQHNPGQPLHHARGKSTDQEDTTIRHIMERTVSEDSNKTFTLTRDIDGTYHMAKACWRLLATFQQLLEAEGAPLARNARLPEGK